MAGVLQDLKVLDLSWGIPGPVASMLLADNGADVTKIEPPGGDPFRALHGYKVWNRGKRSAVLDLKSADDRDKLLALVKTADVFIESYAPGVAKELGVDYETLSALNPRLVYCSISGYGDHSQHKDRPAIDALVAARTGHIYESRGTTGGTPHRLAGLPMPLEGMEPPEADLWAAAPRPGPLFPGVPWISMGTAYLANLGISAALRSREKTGRGQKVSTSLMQGVLLTTIGPWLRAEKADTPNFQTWIVDGRGPKGLFKTKDGRWVHQWVPLPSFILGSSAGDKLEITEEVTKPTEAGMRITPATDDLIILWHYYPEMREAMAKFTAQEWTEHAAKVRVPCQPLLSPEEALQQQTFLDDGCVIEVSDPALGAIRQVGQVYRMSANKVDLAPTPAPEVGADTDAIVAEALAAVGADVPPAPATESEKLTHPLAGIRVLDFGFAVAGPFSTQLLGDLGAEVIKINTMYDGFWMANHVGHCCNRGKRSIAVNLNDPVGQEIARKLVETADIFQHNMGENAMAKIGLGYEDVKKIKPDIIYCHTRAFEEGDHRRGLPGNDQTGAALAGTDWLDSGLDDDGWGHWTGVSLGDTGNGLLAAISMIQAIMHRDRTGEGQFLKTSILYAHLLNASSWVTPDGSERAPRQELDKWCMGYNALYRLYETAEGWIVIAVHTPEQLAALNGVLGTSIDVTPSYSMAPLPNDAANIASLEGIFKTKTAAEWFAALDAAGVPIEVANKDFCLSLFDDPEFVQKGWVTNYVHPFVGREDALGLLVDLSDTPGIIQGPPLVPGQHSRDILTELGYDGADIDKFIEANVVGEMADPHKV